MKLHRLKVPAAAPMERLERLDAIQRIERTLSGVAS
jgi:hypothetical protein